MIDQPHAASLCAENIQKEVDSSLESAIKKISENIGLEWCFLARSLGFTQADIDGIEYAYPRNLKEQIYQFFYQWKRRDGEEATYDKLYAALVDSSLTQLLELQKKLQDKSVQKGMLYGHLTRVG